MAGLMRQIAEQSEAEHTLRPVKDQVPWLKHATRSQLEDEHLREAAGLGHLTTQRYESMTDSPADADSSEYPRC